MSTLRHSFFSHLAQTSTTPLALEIVRAEGIYLYDDKGKKYLDLVSGVAVSNIGHHHPRVTDAIKKQADQYLHLMVYGELIQSPQVLLAKKLTSLLPENLSSVYFVNSGAEANEGAMKLAKRFTGRAELIAFQNAYHGSTQGALSVMGNEYYKNSFRPLLPDIRLLAFNNTDDLQKISSKTAAVIIEPIQGEAGAVPANPEFMKALRKKCNESGALLIFDEIQTGFGRTGKLFAFEHYGTTPDILTLAKAMGGGMPLGAFLASQKIMSSLTANPELGHITTFGGHPLCCAAGLAALEVLLDENLTNAVDEKENLFRELLVHPAIKKIHGKGLLLAVEFEHDDTNKKIITKCIEQGVLTDWFLFSGNRLRIAPPLIISNEEINEACSVMLQVIGKQ